jgi:ketosteroid isomerase-like protein
MAAGKLGDAVDRVKSAVGGGGPPGADEVEGNVGVVRAALRAWGDGDHDGFFAGLDEDVEWIAPTGKKFPAGGTIRGRDEVREKLTGAVEDAYQEFGFRPQQYLETNEYDWVVVLGTFEGAPLKGQDLNAPGVMVWELDGKEAERVRIYTDSELFHEPAPDEEETKRREEERKREKEPEKEPEKERSSSGEGDEGASGEGDEGPTHKGDEGPDAEGAEPGGAGGSERTQGEGGADVPASGESRGEGGAADVRGEEERGETEGQQDREQR